MLTIFFGMILVDILYARLVPGASTAFSRVADILLLVGFATFLTAIVAIAFAWKSKAARSFLIASFLLLLLEFVIPVLVGPFVQGAEGLAIGPWLRVLPSGGASILALIGMGRYYRGE